MPVLVAPCKLSSQWLMGDGAGWLHLLSSFLAAARDYAINRDVLWSVSLSEPFCNWKLRRATRAGPSYANVSNITRLHWMFHWPTSPLPTVTVAVVSRRNRNKITSSSWRQNVHQPLYLMRSRGYLCVTRTRWSSTLAAASTILLLVALPTGPQVVHATRSRRLVRQVIASKNDAGQAQHPDDNQVCDVTTHLLSAHYNTVFENILCK